MPASTNDNRDKKIKRNIRLVVVGVIVFSTLTMAALINKLSTPRILNKHELRDYGVIVLDDPRPILPFELQDHSAQPFGLEQLQGRWSVLFFGFTHCGDICPATMAVLAKTYAELPEKEKQAFDVVLVSVDPARDTPAVMAQYVSGFNQDFVGVTGNAGDLINFASQLSVPYRPGLQGEEPQHSGNLVLVNPRGEIHGFIKPPFAHGSLRVVWRSLKNSFAG